jgi:microcystin-dependent protein
MTAIAGAAVAGTPALAARRRPRAAPPGDGRYVGELRLFAGTYVPESWLGCDGQEYNDLEYSQLAALIGTTYGSVQRDRAFQPLLPDLRGRTAIGAGEGPGHPAWQRGDKERTLAAKGEAPAGLGLRYMISPTGGEEDQLLGEIRAFAFHFAPRYWLPCTGERVEISQHVDVFSLVGDTYGGDAKTYFQTPGLSGRSPLGVGDVLELPRVGLGERFNDLAPSAEPHPRRLHDHLGHRRRHVRIPNAHIARRSGTRGLMLPGAGWTARGAGGRVATIEPEEEADGCLSRDQHPRRHARAIRRGAPGHR